MTETTVSTPATQPESSAPEQTAPVTETPAPTPAPEQPTGTPESDTPKVTAGEVVSEYRKGQRGLAKHSLEAGRLGHGFVLYRVRVLKHERAAAIKALAGQLCDVAGRDVDPNGLIATYHATRLLGEGVDYGRVPYSTLECYQLLVARDPKTEDWSLVPAVETDAKALFVEASTSDPCMPCRDVAKRVAELDAKAKAVRAEQLAKLATDPKAGKAARDKAERAAEQASKAAAKVAAQQQTADKPDAPKVTATAADKPATCAAPAVPLRDMAKRGTAKDVAEMASELITGCETPDDALEHLLRTLKDSTALGNRAKRALAAALLVLTRSDRTGPSPIQVAGALSEHKPTSNGTPATAVA